jgi:hypothetical protein
MRGREKKYVESMAGKPEGNTPLRMSRNRWKNNTYLNRLKKKGSEVWSGFIWLRTGISGAIINIRGP